MNTVKKISAWYNELGDVEYVMEDSLGRSERCTSRKNWEKVRSLAWRNGYKIWQNGLLVGPGGKPL